MILCQGKHLSKGSVYVQHPTCSPSFDSDRLQSIRGRHPVCSSSTNDHAPKSRHILQSIHELKILISPRSELTVYVGNGYKEKGKVSEEGGVRIFVGLINSGEK